jgi:hypothetical protein
MAIVHFLMRNSAVNRKGNVEKAENFVFDTGGFVSMACHIQMCHIAVIRPTVVAIHLKSGAADIAQWRIGVSE